MPDVMDKYRQTIKLASEADKKALAIEKDELQKLYNEMKQTHSEAERKLLIKQYNVRAYKILLLKLSIVSSCIKQLAAAKEVALMPRQEYTEINDSILQIEKWALLPLSPVLREPAVPKGLRTGSRPCRGRCRRTYPRHRASGNEIACRRGTASWRRCRRNYSRPARLRRG